MSDGKRKDALKRELIRGIRANFAAVDGLFSDFADSARKARKYASTPSARRGWDELLRKNGERVADACTQLVGGLADLGKLERGEKRVRL